MPTIGKRSAPEAVLKKAMAIISRRSGGIRTDCLQVALKTSRRATDLVVRDLRAAGWIQTIRTHTFGGVWFSMEHLPAARIRFDAEKLRIKRAMHQRAHAKFKAKVRARALEAAGETVQKATPPPPPRPVEHRFPEYTYPKRRWPAPLEETSRRPPPSSVFELAKHM
jgi:hypothetical protein